MAGAVLGLVTLWGVMYLAFLGWRADIADRIHFGKANVAPVVRPLSDLRPPGIDVEAWNRAVLDSEAMIEDVVGAGRLDRDAMLALRGELTRRVGEARRSPESAPVILGAIWDDMARLKHFRPNTDRPDVLPPPRRPSAKGTFER